MKYIYDKTHNLKYVFNKYIEKVVIKIAINCVRNNKSAGPDKVKNEFIKCAGNKLIEVVEKLFKTIWATEKIR